LDNGRIPPVLFEKYVDFFLQDNPYDDCPKGGHAAYGQAVTTFPFKGGKDRTKVGASYFMTYHTVLKKSSEYTQAMREARMIADNITRTINEGTS